MRHPGSKLLITLAATGLVACERPREPTGTAALAPSSKASADGGRSSASATAPAPSQPDLLDHEVAGLHYSEMITGKAARTDRLPLIVAIHGLGDDPHHFAHLLVELDTPARVLLPRAPDAYVEGGWSWFPVRARDGDIERLADGIRLAADRVAAALPTMLADHPTRGMPIVTGFSQGGMLAFALAVRHPEVVGHAIPVGGWLPPPLIPDTLGSGARYPKIVALHGTADNAVPFEPTKSAVERLVTLGLDVDLRAYPDVKHMITETMRADLHTELAAAIQRTISTKDRAPGTTDGADAGPGDSAR